MTKNYHSSSNIAESIEIKKINFLNSKTQLKLRVNPEINKTSQICGFDKKLLTLLPSLKYHICDNKDKNSFADELQDTEIAHAFEHTLLDIIGKKDSDVKVIGGYTSWELAKKSSLEL